MSVGGKDEKIATARLEAGECWLLDGVKPAIIAIVVQALWGLGRKAIKGPLTALAGAAVGLLSALLR